MGYQIHEKTSAPVVTNEKIEVVDIIDEKKFGQEVESDLSITSTAEDSYSIDGYVSDLQWTEDEERKILTIIDTRLMPFVLLMTFVLNMDRTNICKLVYLVVIMQ
jgi:hypothetical protein